MGNDCYSVVEEIYFNRFVNECFKKIYLSSSKSIISMDFFQILLSLKSIWDKARDRQTQAMTTDAIVGESIILEVESKNFETLNEGKLTFEKIKMIEIEIPRYYFAGFIIKGFEWLTV